MRSSLGAALCVCVLLAAAMPSAVHAQAEDRVMAAPATCPNYCGSCVRMRGKKVLSAETVVVAPASANGREFFLLWCVCLHEGYEAVPYMKRVYACVDTFTYHSTSLTLTYNLAYLSPSPPPLTP